MITEAETMLLMMHGRETACIFHNAYFDIAVMICSAELKAAGFINRLSIKRATVSLHAAAYVPTYAWQTLRKLLLTSKERKAMHSVLWGDAEQYLLKNKPKNSYKLLCEQKKKEKIHGKIMLLFLLNKNHSNTMVFFEESAIYRVL